MRKLSIMIYDLSKPTNVEMLKKRLNNLFKKQATVEVKEVVQPKTLNQNRYIWLCFTHVAFETGATKEDIYEVCKLMFAPFYENTFDPEIDTKKGISKMSKDEMTLFIDHSVTYLRQNGYELPDPDDLTAMQMYSFYHERGLL